MSYHEESTFTEAVPAPCRCGHPECDEHDNGFHVKIPPIGTELPWTQATLLNGTIIASTLMPESHPSLSSPQSKSPLQYQRLHIGKRPKLPILQIRVHNAENNNGKVTCQPKPGQSIRLERLMAAGTDVPSMVFACTIRPGGHEAVLKLLIDQDDKMASNVHVDEDTYVQTNWSKPNLGVNAQMYLSREADRYHDLAALQGLYVPWSYGFYEFTLPGSPSVVGHLMEDIPTVDIEKYFSTIIKNHVVATDAFLTALYRLYIEIHRHDVSHGDVGLRNVMLIPGKTFDFQLALVDFTTSRSISHADRIGQDGLGCDIPLLYAMVTEELDEEIVQKWLRTPRGKRMEELAEMRAQELAEADP